MTKSGHGAGTASRTDHIFVIGYRFTIKLNQTAFGALAKLQSDWMVGFKLVLRRYVLG
jgi:hypothetical protein